LSMATAVLQSLRHHLQYAFKEEARLRRPPTCERAAASADAVRSIVSICCPSLLSAALGKCRRILMLDGESDAQADLEVVVDGYEVVGLLSVASSALDAMLVLPPQSVESSPVFSAQVAICGNLARFCVRIDVCVCDCVCVCVCDCDCVCDCVCLRLYFEYFF